MHAAVSPPSAPLLFMVMCLAAVALLLAPPTWAASNPLCPPCEDGNCNTEPAGCLHGVVRDHCGRKVCARGPGQRCGGPYDIYGICGEGMHCKCDRCAGCSLHTLQCDFADYLCIV